MASVHEKVMAMAERELKKNPKATTTELFEKAKKISRSIEKLSIRQFHAKYPLQVKRKLAPKKRRKPQKATRRGATVPVNREAIRRVLLKFAKDVAGAKDRRAIVDIIAGLDKYVDQVAKAGKV